MSELEQFLESEDMELSLSMQPIPDIKEKLEEQGWIMNNDWETNGWSVDFSIPFEKDGKEVRLGGSWYYGNYTLEKQY